MMCCQSPSEIPSNVLQQIISLIESGGAISAPHLEKRLLRCQCIAYVRTETEIVQAVGALKRPYDSYRQKVFSQSGIPREMARYQIELGYVVVAPDQQHCGLAKQVIKTLLEQVPNVPLFATTKHPAIEHILCGHGFVKRGNVFEHDIQLFTRN